MESSRHDQALLRIDRRLNQAEQRYHSLFVEFRSAVVAAVDDGVSKGHLSRLLGVSEKMIYKYAEKGRAEKDLSR